MDRVYVAVVVVCVSVCSTLREAFTLWLCMYRFPIQLVSDDIDQFGDVTVAIPDGAAVCRTVVCYRIQENGGNFARESYLLMREPVCDYSKDPMSLLFSGGGFTSLIL